MWQEFLCNWNGISIFIDPQFTPAPDLELYTDASGTVGYGGFFQGHWFQGRWPTGLTVEDNPENSMALLELIPIVIAAHLWGPLWSGKRILLHCDNYATVYIIRKARSRSRNINRVIRMLTLTSVYNQFQISAEYIPSKDNDISDALSRFQNERFRRLAPHADNHPTPIPDSLLQELMKP